MESPHVPRCNARRIRSVAQLCARSQHLRVRRSVVQEGGRRSREALWTDSIIAGWALFRVTDFPTTEYGDFLRKRSGLPRTRGFLRGSEQVAGLFNRLWFGLPIQYDRDRRRSFFDDRVHQEALAIL